MAQGLTFTVVGVVLLLLAGLAMMRLSMLRLESPIGRWRDGLRQGTSAPRWRMVDAGGTVRAVPSRGSWQALLFADHSIVSFPKLVAGVARLQHEAPELELLMLSRIDAAVTASACDLAGLRVPLIVVDDRFYKQHNVWVVPHVLILDDAGKVLVAGNVAEESGLLNMWRHAQLMTVDELRTGVR